MAENEGKKGGKLKWLLLFIVVLIAGGATGAWYFFFADEFGRGMDNGTVQSEAVKNLSSKNAPMATLETFLVNLADPLGKRYIKITFDVEMSSAGVAEELVKNKPKIRDSMIMLLSSKTYADLAPAESKLELKTEVASRLNQILGGPKISQVFITEMVIQ